MHALTDGRGVVVLHSVTKGGSLGQPKTKTIRWSPGGWSRRKNGTRELEGIPKKEQLRRGVNWKRSQHFRQSREKRTSARKEIYQDGNKAFSRGWNVGSEGCGKERRGEIQKMEREPDPKKQSQRWVLPDSKKRRTVGFWARPECEKSHTMCGTTKIWGKSKRGNLKIQAKLGHIREKTLC